MTENQDSQQAIVAQSNQKHLFAVHNLMSKFKFVGNNVPFTDYPKPPFNGTITGWYKYDDVYIAKTDVIQPGHMFCSIQSHRKWLEIPRFQFYYVRRHLMTHEGHAQEFRQNKNQALANLIQNDPSTSFDSNQRAIIKRAIYSYLLTSDRPFTDADNSFLKSICPIISSGNLRNEAHNISNKVRNDIKQILHEAQFLRASIDEWSDSSNRRYIGETIYMIHKEKWIQITVALKYVSSLHATAKDIANILDLIDIQYELDATQMRYCSDNCNTMLAVQTEKGIARFPCVIHHIHIIAKVIITKQKKFVQLLQDVVGYFHSSCVFSSYCQSHGLRRIPKFTIVRWCSANETLQYLVTNQDHIQTFIRKEKLNMQIPKDFFEQCRINAEFTDIMKSCILELEGDDFGTISKVHQIFNIVENAVKEYPEISQEMHDVKELALNKMSQFQNDFRQDLFPLILVAEFLNPSLKLQLDKNELKTVVQYIAKRAEIIGMPLPNQNAAISSSQSRNSLIQYSDVATNPVDIIELLKSNSNRHLERDPEKLLNFWIEKLHNDATKGVAYVALEALSTLCNSASVEREFSSAKHILTMNRMRLLPEITEDLLIISTNQEIAKKYLDKI